jgi:retron-type reverse transcriptase
MSDPAHCADQLTHSQTRWSAPLQPPLNPALLDALASALLAGDAALEAIISRLSHTLGRPWLWLRPLARRFLKAFANHSRPRHRTVVEFLKNDVGLQRAWLRHHRKLTVKHWLSEPPQMQPAPARTGWHVPAIESVHDLANWLSIDLSELYWYADLKGLERQPDAPRLRHYHYRLLTKSSGGLRLIEGPKVRLKQLQRAILSRVLQHIPPHSSAHGFIPHRSIKTFAGPHAGHDTVLRMDLRDFFPSLHAARIQALFRTAGYPEAVANLLTGLCTNVTPRDIWGTAPNLDLTHLREAIDLYSRPHLPQGAPTSPTLANLCAYRMDCRLAGLAQSVGATYTRYADDLAFSGDATFTRKAQRFSTHVAAILQDEGFHVHHRKTRIMRQGVRQHLAGLVINDRPNIRRRDYDQLKAILTNCIRLGPETQNREFHPRFQQHLEGRIEFARMINPERATRLQRLFREIAWPNEDSYENSSSTSST